MVHLYNILLYASKVWIRIYISVAEFPLGLSYFVEILGNRAFDSLNR